jgi:hypothetical protein
MKNFNQEQLEKLGANSNNFHELMASSSQWVKRNLRLEERQNLLNNIHEIKSEIATIQESIDTKPVFALFGVSQVGKSYLVKNLLSVEGKNLEIQLPNNENLDFLQSINPRGGGTESTGVVSRFSIDNAVIDENYPIKVKLLDVKDIVLILCDSFFCDIMKLDSYPTAEDFKNHVNKFKDYASQSTQQQTVLNEDHLFYIKKYFEDYLERSSANAATISRSHFWLGMSEVIDKIDSSKWIELFEILWAFDKEFSNLFSRMLNALSQVSYQKTVYVTKQAILRDEGKILDVMRVEGIFGPEERTPVLLPNGNKIEFDLHLLSALTSEITMPVSQEVAEQKEFLKNTDLLDFPGARSRKPFEKGDLNKSLIPTLLLRGKIAYLFNKYSSNYEINNLLFCLKNYQNEVKEIPLLINDWIKRNVGSTSEERELRIGANNTNPLFIVLTFYNETMKFNPNSDQGDLSEKWDKRFIRLFKEETVTKAHDWDENWTRSQPKFKSFYMLRDYQFSEDVFTGFNTQGKELEIQPDKLEYYDRLKDSFLNFPYVNDHFEDPLISWNASSTPNNDGSEKIISDLYPAANNLIKTKNYIGQLANFRVETLKKLNVYYKSDDIQNQRRNAFDQGNIIRDQLRKLFSNNDGVRFGEFLSKMFISNTETYNYIHEHFLPASEDHTPTKEEVILRTYDLDPSKTVDENKLILKERLVLESLDAVEEWLVKNDIDLELVLANVHITAASVLVDGVLDIWKANLNVENFKSFNQYGLDDNTVALINENLIQTFEIFNVRTELIHIFEKKTRLMKVSNDTDEYLASIISSYINDFVSNFGFNFMSDERLSQVLELAKEFSIDNKLLLISQEPLSELEIQNLFDEDDSTNDLTLSYPVVEHYKSFITKIQLILLSNCGFRAYNIEENENLKGILQNIEQLTFNNA